jgi:kynurenine 3-monooxygenase
LENVPIVIVGGGLVGSLAAIYLARRGHAVSIRERRPDPRRAGAEGGRSINLVVTWRGIDALSRVGLDRPVLALTVPVRGRMLHSPEGRLAFQPYGRDASEANHSISRAGLNRFLLDEAARCGVGLRFGAELVGGDLAGGVLRFEDAGGAVERVEAGLVVGADGAGSAVRRALVARAGFAERVELLAHGYKELEIPADRAAAAGLEREALHLWPRGTCMMMALPNLDGSFTVTLYLPHEGADSFAALDRPEAVRALCAREFPDALALIPDLERDFLRNPTGELGTVRVSPWHLDGRTVLIGDAAHAIVPFFGQGMNCGFEDCVVLDGLIDRHGGSWDEILAAFTRARRPDAEAIADMALDNFVEMRDRVGDPAFLLRKEVEHRMELAFPSEYRSRYSMVTYSSIPYRVALEAGRIQEGILRELCAGLARAEELDLARARRLVRERLGPLLERHRVSLDY